MAWGSSDRHWIPPWATWIKVTSSRHISVRRTLILSSHLKLMLPGTVLPSDFRLTFLCTSYNPHKISTSTFQLNLLDSVKVIKAGEEHKSWNSPFLVGILFSTQIVQQLIKLAIFITNHLGYLHLFRILFKTIKTDWSINHKICEVPVHMYWSKFCSICALIAGSVYIRWCSNPPSSSVASQCSHPTEWLFRISLTER
jgi:hypothetical protein